jgi:hypothetical protein
MHTGPWRHSWDRLESRRLLEEDPNELAKKWQELQELNLDVSTEELLSA